MALQYFGALRMYVYTDKAHTTHLKIYLMQTRRSSVVNGQLKLKFTHECMRRNMYASIRAFHSTQQQTKNPRDYVICLKNYLFHR